MMNAMTASRLSQTVLSNGVRVADGNLNELAQHRKQNRDYMRRWRTTAANRAKKKRRFAGLSWQRRLERATQGPREGEIPKCAYCHHESIVRIDRLRPTDTGFKKVELPYCGLC
jgi:hypothetical protein